MASMRQQGEINDLRNRVESLEHVVAKLKKGAVKKSAAKKVKNGTD